MRFPPLDVVETWPKPNYIDPERRGHASVVIQCILVFLATVIVFIRLYARVAITKARVGIDDAIIIISLVCRYHSSTRWITNWVVGIRDRFKR